MSLQIGSLASVGSVTPSGWFNVKDYGATGNSTTDDTAAINAALTALRASVNVATTTSGGQTLFFPPGLYKTTSSLNFTGLQQVRVLGGSGRGTWATADFWPSCGIYYTGGGSVNAVNLANTNGVVWDGVSVVAANTSFTGVLLNMDSTIIDLFGNRLQNMVLRSYAPGSCTLLTGAKQIEFSVDNVNFSNTGQGGAGTQVRGVSASNNWFNANTFRDCSFVGERAYSVLNPSTQTTFIGCTFEGTQAAVAAPVSVQQRGQSGCDTLTFVGCGFWDVATGSTPWISTTVATEAFAFTGCHFDGPPTGPIFDLSGHQGLSLNGCFFNSLGGGTPNIFKPGQNITNGSMQGCYVKSPLVDNHASVFV